MSLNRQFIAVLAGRGVAASVFHALQSEVLSALYHCCDSAEAAKVATSYFGNDSIDADLRQLVQLGLFGEALVVQRLARQCAEKIRSIKDKAHIPVRASRRCLLISDPTGYLLVRGHGERERERERGWGNVCYLWAVACG